MRIGIDFDNTIVRYDDVFERAARSRGLLPDSWTAADKTAVRDHLRRHPDGEKIWQGLQGWVYGKGISEAEPFPGVADFLASCRDCGAIVSVVSHKTRYGHQDPDRIDLREAARGWLAASGLVCEGGALSVDRVFFEDTLEDKVSRIAALDLDIFIDDLPEVFAHPRFPPWVAAILFSRTMSPPPPILRLRSWDEIRRKVLG